jgi:DNA-binding phage protein
MATVQVRIEGNALTKPQSYSVRFVAKDAELGDESLHKLLAPGVKLPYDTMLKLLHALGIKLSAKPLHAPV